MSDTVVGSTSNTSMADRPLVLQAKSGDTAIAYQAADFRELTKSVFPGEGVLSAADMKITQNGSGDGTVNVAAGQGVILGDGAADLGAYLVTATGSVNLTVPVAPTSVTRVHRCIARVRDSQVISGTQYDWTYEILEDTGAGTPSLPGSAISLGLVPRTGATSVLTTAITDLRDMARRDPLNAWGIIGGQTWSSTGAQLGTNVTGGSPAATVISSGTVTTVTGRRYRLRTRFASNVTVSNATDVFYLVDSVGGATKGGQVYEARKVNTEYVNDVVAEFDETAGGSRTYTLWAYWFGAGGGAAHDIIIRRFSSGSTDRAGLIVEDIGPAGLVTNNT